MAAFTMMGYGDDDDNRDEQQELEMYGLMNSAEDDGDEDESGEDVEQAMWMKIHYGDVDDDEKQDHLEDASKALASPESLEVVGDDVTKDEISIQVNSYSSDETLIDGKRNRQVDKSKLDGPVEIKIIGEATECSNNVSLASTLSSKESDSKYSLIKSNARSASETDTNRTESVDKEHFSQNIHSDSKYRVKKTGRLSEPELQGIIVSDSSVEICKDVGQSDIFVIDTVAHNNKEGAETARKKKIDRSSLTPVAVSPATTDDDHDVMLVKKRSWNTRNGQIKSQQATKTQRTWAEWVKGNKGISSYKSVVEVVDSDSEKDSDSGSDCMVIESMSEDEDFDFNLESPFQPRISKQGELNTYLRKDRKQIPKCDICEEYGHLAESCPKAEDADNSSVILSNADDSLVILSNPDDSLVILSNSTSGGESSSGTKGSRCKNCSGFGHSAKECPSPIQNASTSVLGGLKRTPAGKQKTPNRYFQSSTPERGGSKCMNCYEFDHLARDCPQPTRTPTCVLCGYVGHFDLVCPDALCYNCNLPGHRKVDCESMTPARYMKCWRCGGKGHNDVMCPDHWRQYHLSTEPDTLIVPNPIDGENWNNTTQLYCSNCSQQGHHAYECEDGLMDFFLPPVYPFVYIYDREFTTPKWKREKKSKFAGLEPKEALKMERQRTKRRDYQAKQELLNRKLKQVGRDGLDKDLKRLLLKKEKNKRKLTERRKRKKLAKAEAALNQVDGPNDGTNIMKSAGLTKPKKPITARREKNLQIKLKASEKMRRALQQEHQASLVADLELTTKKKRKRPQKRRKLRKNKSTIKPKYEPKMTRSNSQITPTGERQVRFVSQAQHVGERQVQHVSQRGFRIHKPIKSEPSTD